MVRPSGHVMRRDTAACGRRVVVAGPELQAAGLAVALKGIGVVLDAGSRTWRIPLPALEDARLQAPGPG
jgi:hypothetical protein